MASKTLLDNLKKQLSEVRFNQGEAFFWSPRQQTISYPSLPPASSTMTHAWQWALLHEAAHALLHHQNYHSDAELLLMEVEAWEKAKQLGQINEITIDPEHIEDCLDTYRDWLHQRSTCPACGVVSLQASSNKYRCLNCQTTWQVSSSRFCRPYRLTVMPKEKILKDVKTATFK